MRAFCSPFSVLCSLWGASAPHFLGVAGGEEDGAEEVAVGVEDEDAVAVEVLGVEAADEAPVGVVEGDLAEEEEDAVALDLVDGLAVAGEAEGDGGFGGGIGAFAEGVGALVVGADGGEGEVDVGDLGSVGEAEPILFRGGDAVGLGLLDDGVGGDLAEPREEARVVGVEGAGAVEDAAVGAAGVEGTAADAAATTTWDYTSPSYLAAMTLDVAGAPLTDFQKAQLAMRSQIPALSGVGTRLADGTWISSNNKDAMPQAYDDFAQITYLEFARKVE